jgi:hypothetical protein
MKNAQFAQNRMRLCKPLDIPVIALSALVAIGSVVFAASARGKTAVLVVSSPAGEYRYMLDKNVTAPIPGVLGDSIIVIENGRARFVDSPCENKICVLHSPLGAAGHWSACLPNQIMLRVEGVSDDGIDILTN